MKYFKYGIKLKLVILISIILLVPALIAFIAMFFVTGSNYYEKVEVEIRKTVEIMQEFSRNNMTTDEIIDYFDLILPHSIEKVESISQYNLSKEELAAADRNDIVIKSVRLLFETSIFTRINDDYVVIFFNNQSVFQIDERLRLFGILFTFIILSIVLFFMISNKVLAPIYRLNEATKRVAKGDFDVEINVETNDEIGELSKNFNMMTIELKSIEMLRYDFISSVSHEFKTPIASINGYMNLLEKDNKFSEKSSKYMQAIYYETDMLSNLISKILELSNIENMGITQNRSTFYLDEEIRLIIVSIENKWADKNIDFDINLDEIKASFDRGLFAIVIKNIIDNSIKFTGRNGKISVDLYKEDSNILIRIADNGIGMDENTRSRIFNKFYQGDSSHSTQGSGLGLAMVKKIIDIFDGEIIVESEPGKGSSFLIVLKQTKLYT